MKLHPFALLCIVTSCLTAAIIAQEPAGKKDPAAPKLQREPALKQLKEAEIFAQEPTGKKDPAAPKLPQPPAFKRDVGSHAPELQTMEWKEFATADVKDVEFDGSYGAIGFTIGDAFYHYSPGYTSDRSVCAVAAVLAELRRAKKFKAGLLVPRVKQPMRYIVQLVILYDDLK